MQSFEYKVIPAPAKGEKERGLKTGADRFAHALSLTMNELAAEGWEYWRAETLPAEERTGLTSKTTVFHNLLVFRRALGRPVAPADFGGSVFGGAALREGNGLQSMPQDAQPERRGKLLSVFAPEGRAPRLGPAEEDEA